MGRTSLIFYGFLGAVVCYTFMPCSIMGHRLKYRFHKDDYWCSKCHSVQGAWGDDDENLIKKNY